jgi:hypothetical protein
VRELQRVFGVGLSLLLVAGRAAAESQAAFTLDWAAPAGCSTGDDVRARAESLLGGPIEPRLVHALTARGRVTPVDDGLELRLETVDNGLRGERTLRGATCGELASAAALIIALAVDPETVAARSKDASTAAAAGVSAKGVAATASAPATAPAAAPPKVSASPPAEHGKNEGSGAPVTGLVEADVAFDLGALPGLAIGPSLSGGFALSRLRLRVGATYFAPRFAEAPPEAGKPARGADVSLLVLGLAGCYALTPRPVEVGVCGELEGGALLAVGSGFDHTNDAIKPWLAAGASVDLTVPIAGPVALRVGVGAMVPFGRSPVRFTEITGDVPEIHTIHQPAYVSGRAAAGVSFAFR